MPVAFLRQRLAPFVLRQAVAGVRKQRRRAAEKALQAQDVDIVKERFDLAIRIALKQFALDGLGLALFPCFFVEKELASGKLVQAMPDHAPPELSINAVYETRRHLLPKLQAFLGFLKERFGADA